MAVIDGDAKKAEALTRAALGANLPPMEIIGVALVPAMHEVGERFKREQCFVPEMLLSARAMKTALALIKPLLVTSEVQGGPRAVIGTVRGDLHDIGKNLVGMMLEGAGFEVTDLGSNVPPEQFVRAVAETGAEVVGLSALLSTTMMSIPATIEALRQAGLRDHVVVLIGGAPVTSQFARHVGADGYARNAARAVDVAQELLRSLAAPAQAASK
ncbi:MAG: corrinoid protein [Chloroflexi bacterium]|nr:corrinoid protein [Chloroflexota bacterium]